MNNKKRSLVDIEDLREVIGGAGELVIPAVGNTTPKAAPAAPGTSMCYRPWIQPTDEEYFVDGE